MKKATRFLAMILCVCALMGVMAPAASAVTILTIINLTVDAPVAGQKPATTASVPSHARSAVKKVEWSGQLDSNGAFKEGVRYKVTITMGIKKGEDCKFSNKSINAKVNEKAADEVLWYANDKVEVIYTFPAASSKAQGKAIDTIILTVDAPASGKQPATTAKLTAGSNGTVNSVVKDIKWSGQLDTDGTFMPRVKYKVTFTMGIKPGANYYFSDKAIGATINGKDADEVLWYAGDHVEVIYTFPAYGTGNTLSSNWITMDGPAAGERPATTAHLASTASSYVSNIRWEGALDSSGRFQAGTEYTAYITLKIKDEFKDRKFSSKSFNAYINGVLMDEVTRISDKELLIAVEFEKTPGNAPASGNTQTPGSVPASDITPTKTAFSDVLGNDYFAQPVQWAVNNKITSGTSDTTFSPNQTCTQAQILTFLWRATGSPKPQGTVEMEGFTGNEYYYQAAMWAGGWNMIRGNFSPDAPCTRAMAVSFMWNYAGYPSAAASNFTDVSANADYANAVAWAVANGVTSGTSATTFSPDQSCTRGQIVTFLYRAFAK